MNTITRELKVKVQDNVKEAIKWLEKEHPNGIDLVYVDYRDCYEDMAQLQSVLKQEMEDINDNDWIYDNQYDSRKHVKNEYRESIEADELTEEVDEAMDDWLNDHDTSDPIKDTIKNTGSKLFYIETKDYANEGGDIKQEKELIKKYARTEAEKKDIRYVLNNQFYGAPVSFYFYAKAIDMYNAINQDSKYITIKNAYFSTIDRVQGSNWLGNEGIFNIAIERSQFMENFFLDEAKGNGYGWGSIAGQSGYDEAEISAAKTKGDSLLVQCEQSEAQKREAELEANWKKTGTCTFGDMNWNRHKGDKPYSNNYPCGNKCETCGTFWID